MDNISLYHRYRQYSYEELQELFKEAKNKEEQDFYMALANLLLKAKQEKIVDKNII